MAATGDELVTLSQLKSVIDGKLDLTEDGILVKAGSNVDGFGMINMDNRCAVSMYLRENAAYIALMSGQYVFGLVQDGVIPIPSYTALGQDSPLFLDPSSSTYEGDVYIYFNIVVPN